MRILTLLAATTMLAAAMPASAQTEPGRAAFRVPIGSTSPSTSGPAVYAWLENVGTCSSTCGNGTRTTTYQCQDVSSYDYVSGGYGAPEASTLCSATSPMPSGATNSCTNYSGCSYDWVKPPVVATILAKPNAPNADFPKGAVADCSYAKRTFSPYCQRDGTPKVQLAAGDYAFCRNDLPDYSDVAAGKPDALGYDRTSEVKTACVAGPRDYDWRSGTWATPAASPSATCTAARTRTRTAECFLKFNGEGAPDSLCAGVAKPSTSETIPADYSGCSYTWETGPYGAWSSNCSSSATRVRTIQCRRSDGTPVANSDCTSHGVAAPASSETAGVYDQCGYARGDYTGSTDWNSHCSSNAQRTNSYNCKRADGAVVASAECTNRGIAVTEQQSSAVYDQCGYARGDYTGSTDWNSHCSSNAQRTNSYNCKRADGTVVANAECTNRGIAVTEQQSSAVYDQCGYNAVNWSGYSACQNNQQTSSAQCQRSDGAIVGDGECSNRGVPVTRTQSCTSESVWDGWYVGGCYGDWLMAAEKGDQRAPDPDGPALMQACGRAGGTCVTYQEAMTMDYDGTVTSYYMGYNCYRGPPVIDSKNQNSFCGGGANSTTCNGIYVKR